MYLVRLSSVSLVLVGVAFWWVLRGFGFGLWSGVGWGFW